MRTVVLVAAFFPLFAVGFAATHSLLLALIPWLVLAVGAWLRPPAPPLSPRGPHGPGPRPIPRLTSTDPLDPLWGTRAEFPADPDANYDAGHHQVWDPDRE